MTNTAKSNIGKFFSQKDKDFAFLIYEEKHHAMATWAATVTVQVEAARKTATSWSETINSKVVCSNPNDIIFVINAEDHLPPAANYGMSKFVPKAQLWHVITGEKSGWIIVRNNFSFEEVKPDGV